MAIHFRSERSSNATASQRQEPEFRQWPVQLTLVSPQASYFKDDKMTELIKTSITKSITLVNMEVPCCFGLQRIVEEAVKKSGKVVPIRQTVISIKGNLFNK